MSEQQIVAQTKTEYSQNNPLKGNEEYCKITAIEPAGKFFGCNIRIGGVDLKDPIKIAEYLKYKMNPALHTPENDAKYAIECFQLANGIVTRGDESGLHPNTLIKIEKSLEGKLEVAHVSLYELFARNGCMLEACARDLDNWSNVGINLHDSFNERKVLNEKGVYVEMTGMYLCGVREFTKFSFNISADAMADKNNNSIGMIENVSLLCTNDQQFLVASYVDSKPTYTWKKISDIDVGDTILRVLPINNSDD